VCGHDQLDTDIGDAFSEFFGQVVGNFEAAARGYSLPAFAVKAVHMLGTPMTMKELGQQFHCDPSFVTAIADLLDTHGLARREPDARDRRIKHLRLTPKGLEFRERVEREVLARMPWNYALDTRERESLLALLRKMIEAENERRSQATARGTVPDGVTVPAGQAADGSGSSDTADDSDTGHDTPPATTGGHRAGEVTREPTSATLSGR
jgi:DNA-binding MarR family transcriptional regulator